MAIGKKEWRNVMEKTLVINHAEHISQDLMDNCDAQLIAILTPHSVDISHEIEVEWIE